jgi:hypothetical protein
MNQQNQYLMRPQAEVTVQLVIIQTNGNAKDCNHFYNIICK